MLKLLTAELSAKDSEFVPAARTAVVADPAPAWAAGRPEPTGSGPRPLSGRQQALLSYGRTAQPYGHADPERRIGPSVRHTPSISF